MDTKVMLKRDKDMYYGWQSNIAMAFYDEYCRLGKRYVNRKDLHTISNRAAKNFLDLLIK